MSNRRLNPSSTVKIRKFVMLAVDIQPCDSGDFESATVYGEGISESFTSVQKLRAYLDSLKNKTLVLAFYNQLAADVSYLEPIIDSTSVLWAGTRVITATLNNGISCMDLYNHTMDGTMEQWGEYILDTPKNRAELTHRLGQFLQDFYTTQCGVEMGLTVGGNALKMFKTHYLNEYWWRKNDELSAFERQSYFGGRCEIFKRGRYHHYAYDIRKTYLSIMVRLG